MMWPKDLVGVDSAYYFLNVTPENLDGLKINLELVYHKIRPTKYLACLKEKLKKAIEENREKKKIENHALRFISLLIHIGYSQNYIYYKTNKFFFKEERISSIDDIDRYFEMFDLKSKEYEMFVRISKLFLPLRDACKNFDVEIIDDDSDYKKINALENSCLIKVSNIKSLDPYSARNIADSILLKIGDLFTFFYHKERLKWGENVIVRDVESKEEFYRIKKASPMKKGLDYYPKKAAERLTEMLKTLSMGDESFYRINRGIDFHGTSLENHLPENQLIQNWMALETLIVTNSNDSKINLILKGLIPILNYHYIKRIFSNLTSDIERLKDEVLNEIIGKIPEGDCLLDKVTALYILENKFRNRKGVYGSM